MRFIAVELGVKTSANYILGYLRVPDDLPPSWFIGFRQYLIDKYKVEPKIYPIPVHQNTTSMTVYPKGYTNMEDDFNLALRSLKYYPSSQDNDATKRAYAKLDPTSSMFIEKKRIPKKH